jgi:hypothetical protein
MLKHLLELHPNLKYTLIQRHNQYQIPLYPRKLTTTIFNNLIFLIVQEKNVVVDTALVPAYVVRLVIVYLQVFF